MSAVLLTLAATFASLSLVAIGGINVLLPEIRRQVVDVHGWMSEPAFASLFAIANAAPGPNVIVVSLVGWQVAGPAGLLVATLAIVPPACLLAFWVGRALARWGGTRPVQVIKAAWAPLGLGLMLASGVTMMRAVDQDLLGLVISLGTALFIVTSRRNPLWPLAAGTLASVVALHV